MVFEIKKKLLLLFSLYSLAAFGFFVLSWASNWSFFPPIDLILCFLLLGVVYLIIPMDKKYSQSNASLEFKSLVKKRIKNVKSEQELIDVSNDIYDAIMKAKKEIRK